MTYIKLSIGLNILIPKMQTRAVITAVSTFVPPSSRFAQQSLKTRLTLALRDKLQPSQKRWLLDEFDATRISHRHMIWHPALINHTFPEHFPNPDGDSQAQVDNWYLNESILKASHMLRVASSDSLAWARIPATFVDKLTCFTDAWLAHPQSMDEHSHAGHSYTMARRSSPSMSSGVVSIRESAEFLRAFPSFATQVCGVSMGSRQWASPGLGHALRSLSVQDMAGFRSDVTSLMLSGDIAGSLIMFGSDHPEFERAAYKEGGLVVVDSHRYNAPLHRDVPLSRRGIGSTQTDIGVKPFVSEQLPGMVVPPMVKLVRDLLKDNDVPLSSVGSFLVNPFSVQVLDALAANLEVGRHKMGSSYNTLESYGNCSGAGIFRVIQREMQTGSQGNTATPVVLLDMVPGMSYEAVLAYRYGSSM